MAMEKKIACYVSNTEEAQAYIKKGASDIIISPPQFNIRSMQSPWTSEKHTLSLLLNIKKNHPKITLWVDIDKTSHPEDMDQIASFIKTLHKHDITHIKSSDIATLMYCKINFANNIRWFSPEFGYASSLAIKESKNLAHITHLSNDCPINSIQNLNHTNTLSILLLGPILIQYSKRRYISYLNQNKQATIHYITDTQHPHKTCKVYDSPLGHIMFAHFDRCLITEYQQLLNSPIKYLLIDSRGESNNYTLNALKLLNMISKKTPKAVIKQQFANFKKSYPRPLCVSYFHQNNSDHNRHSKRAILNNKTKIATVVGLIKPHLIALECLPGCPILNIGDQLYLANPSNKPVILTIQTLVDPFLTPLKNSENKQIICINWKKGIESKAWVYLNN